MHNDRIDQLYPQHLQEMMRRADDAMAANGFDSLVIHAGAPVTQYLDDQDYPYKPNPNFKAWVPITDNPQCALIYRCGSKPTLLFHQPDDFWHKAAQLPTADWTDSIHLVPVASAAQARAHWINLPHAALIGPPEVFTDAAPAAINPPELMTRLHYERAVKTEYELQCMRRATDLGVQGHLAALAAFRGGASEYDAHMQYLRGCEQREEEMPYNNIVAYNENAAVLHYQHLERKPPSVLRSLLIDAGAQYRGYACDITRTYAAEPGLFLNLVNALEVAQLFLCSQIEAGRDYRDVHLVAHRVLGDVLQSCGVIKLSGQDALEKGLTSVFFPHGIGHLLGLQVHDVGGVLGDAGGRERERPAGHPYLRLTRMLEPGVVVTVEPGIYIIDSLLQAAHKDARRQYIDWEKVDALRPFGGIRIEDNVVATSKVPENMTRNAFAKLAA